MLSLDEMQMNCSGCITPLMFLSVLIWSQKFAVVWIGLKKNENLSRKELERKIRSIDKNRTEVREIITHKGWGVHTSYHLTVNATDWNLKELTLAIAAFAESWFRRTNP